MILYQLHMIVSNPRGDVDMTYAFIHDVPLNDEMYAKLKAELGDVTPAGLIAHVVIRQPDGLRYVDVWQDEASWDRFREEQVEPAVGRMLASYGIPHDHAMVHTETIDVVDVWLGAA
jgi:hypothetical protein